MLFIDCIVRNVAGGSPTVPPQAPPGPGTCALSETFAASEHCGLVAQRHGSAAATSSSVQLNIGREAPPENRAQGGGDDEDFCGMWEPHLAAVELLSFTAHIWCLSIAASTKRYACLITRDFMIDVQRRPARRWQKADISAPAPAGWDGQRSARQLPTPLTAPRAQGR